MATLHLRVMTVDRCFYDDDVDRIIIRTTQGDVGILPNHVPYIAAIGIGCLTIFKEGEKRVSAVAGGFVEVSRDQTVVLARTCEWADEIDVYRAREAAERARAAIRQRESSREQDLAQAKLKKAVNRIRIAENK